MVNNKFFLYMFIFVIDIFAFQNDKWIIVTTIQYPTDSLKKLARLSGWQLLVIGDKKTPIDWHLDEKCIYLSPEDQERLPYRIAKLLPWNHYARKNIGYLYAIQNGAQMIYETDDDNYVLDDIRSFRNDRNIISLSSKSSVINVYDYFGQPTLWPRGYPLSKITHNEFTETKFNFGQKIMIEQGLVDNEPDVDAILRLTRKNNSCIYFDKKKPVCILSGRALCPFNSQNTLFHKEVFWGLYIPTYVSFRVCDIWRGYIIQRLLWEINGCICFTPPTAIQERNCHDFMEDFVGELDLYLKVDDLIRLLLTWVPTSSDIMGRFKDLYKCVIDNNFIGEQEIELLLAWIDDFKEVSEKIKN